MLALAQLSELDEDGGQLFRQGRVWTTELILGGTKTESKWLSSARMKQASTRPQLGGCRYPNKPDGSSALWASLAQPDNHAYAQNTHLDEKYN